MLTMIVELPVDSILDRENSQRKEYNDIESLADSIRRIGLLHPIVVDSDNRLVAGGRRLAAYKHLGMQTIPTTSRDNLDSSDRRIIELEENVKRKNISWQEEAQAVVEIETILRESNPEWTRDLRAAYVGYTESAYNRFLTLGRAILAGNERVIGAQNATAALNIIEREGAREKDNETNKLFDIILGNRDDEPEEEPAIPSDIGDNPSPKPSARVSSPKVPNAITQGDMLTWMPEYSGPRFNLIHCDFPYGINHGKSDQGGAKNRWEAYEDSPDVYWTLLETLLKSRDLIMLPSCHIIFWLSARFDFEYGTRKMIEELAPELDVDEYNLIWHKTDNKGIIRDPNHTPRNVYEKALFITRGQRKIIKAVANVYGAPTGKADAIHISEKPVPMLKHFMQLCVDGHTELLDPTCGGGSAIRAAYSMGAKRVVGRELNPDYAEAAQRELAQMIAIESLRKKED